MAADLSTLPVRQFQANPVDENPSIPVPRDVLRQLLRTLDDQYRRQNNIARSMGDNQLTAYETTCWLGTWPDLIEARVDVKLLLLLSGDDSVVEPADETPF